MMKRGEIVSGWLRNGVKLYIVCYRFSNNVI